LVKNFIEIPWFISLKRIIINPIKNVDRETRDTCLLGPVLRAEAGPGAADGRTIAVEVG
jgi:hypothetical protein